MTEWQRLATTEIVHAHRAGWRGVVDAIYAWWARTPRLTVPTPVTVSVWVRPIGTTEVRLSLEQMQAEWKETQG